MFGRVHCHSVQTQWIIVKRVRESTYCDSTYCHFRLFFKIKKQITTNVSNSIPITFYCGNFDQTYIGIDGHIQYIHVCDIIYVCYDIRRFVDVVINECVQEDGPGFHDT